MASTVSVGRRVKSLAQIAIPASLYTRGSRIYRDGLIRAGLWSASLKYGEPETLLYFGIAPGDDLLCTAVLRELKKRGQRNVWMISNYPELFQGMNDATAVVPLRFPLSEAFEFKRRKVQYCTHDIEADRSDPPKAHIIAELCKSVGITGDVTLRPYLKLASREEWVGTFAQGKIVIQSSGLGCRVPMKNKQWPPERFQAIVDQLHNQLDFIQIGSEQDPVLRHATDLRGKTSIREAAAILAHARLYVGSVGFLMHLARAVETPSVIVYGGREAPWQSGYVANQNLYSALPCSPCWRYNECDYDRKCLNDITTEDVIKAVQSKLNSHRESLSLETVTIK
jgi:hypothetical protein